MMRRLERSLSPADGLWFQHKSSVSGLITLRPRTYQEILEQRSLDMDEEDAARYVEERIVYEGRYHDVLSLGERDRYCGGVRGDGSPEEYPGCTYYFRMNRHQVEGCGFELVAGRDHSLDLPVRRGLGGLLACVAAWRENVGRFEPYEDDLIGRIDPRIEVIVPRMFAAERKFFEFFYEGSFLALDAREGRYRLYLREGGERLVASFEFFPEDIEDLNPKTLRKPRQSALTQQELATVRAFVGRALKERDRLVATLNALENGLGKNLL